MAATTEPAAVATAGPATRRLPGVVTWEATMSHCGTQWTLAADADWHVAYSQYGAHADYEMVRDSEARKCFRNPDGGAFSKHVYAIKKNTSARFMKNGWYIALQKIVRPDAALSAPLMPHGACHPPPPTCNTCSKYGQPEIGAEIWVRGSVFMCAEHSPSGLASYVIPHRAPSEDDYYTMHHARDAATEACAEALEALVQLGRVEQGFTAEMAAPAYEFVKAAIAKEDAAAALVKFMEDNADTPAHRKRPRT